MPFEFALSSLVKEGGFCRETIPPWLRRELKNKGYNPDEVSWEDFLKVLEEANEVYQTEIEEWKRG